MNHEFTKEEKTRIMQAFQHCLANGKSSVQLEDDLIHLKLKGKKVEVRHDLFPDHEEAE